MERRYQVFVSSTFQDLREERAEVIQALLELDCIPASMELFPASNNDAWTLIQRVIDDCDYYVVIVGGRYGSLSDEGISFTEREYDYAVAHDKPVLGFIHRSPDEIPAGKTDRDPQLAVRLDAFRAKVMQKTVRDWTTAHELGSVVSRSLVRLMKDVPAEGWVQGRYAITPERQTEITELRAENLELRQELARKAAPLDTTELAQGDEEVELDFEIGTSFIGTFSPQHKGKLKLTWNELFRIVAPSMLDEAAEDALSSKLESVILGLAQVKTDYTTRVVVRTAPILDVTKIQLSSLGLIEKGTKRRPPSDKGTYWRLTAAGERLLYSLSAVRKEGAALPPQPTATFTKV